MPDNGAEKLRNAAGALSAVADLINEAANDFEESIKALKGRVDFLEHQVAKNNAFRNALIETLQQYKD